MEMFTVKQSESSLMACCRACGHEQPLPMTSPDAEEQAAVSIKCERCPSEDAYVAVPAPTDAVTETV
ncbi:hypothetical protein CUR86_09195 [Salinicola acroporae]|uniref:Uncharacterized protein n=1 Tax=Salinicola acroporae TaxID=1541440 RepID=A0ABT6I4L6_9GAMM|nr:hypothetical protein [Salinicola acroporae]